MDNLKKVKEDISLKNGLESFGDIVGKAVLGDYTLLNKAFEMYLEQGIEIALEEATKKGKIRNAVATSIYSKGQGFEGYDDATQKIINHIQSKKSEIIDKAK